ncbi:hypothetical protein V9L05_18805 [Bernardetia sp. Wsw4-3y2]|uniref:hypothetical protein n=1 Tax=Bernardetia sp. Wsw4-3y2 TaxID=3127471 RepID=UPI0030CB6627
MLEIAQGTDTTLEVIVTNKETQFVDLTDANIERIYATVRLGRHDKFKFASDLVGIGGYLLCEVDATITHKLLVKLTREQTRTLDIGTINIDVSIDYTDTSFTNNLRREEFQFNKLAEVVKGSSRLIS